MPFLWYYGIVSLNTVAVQSYLKKLISANIFASNTERERDALPRRALPKYILLCYVSHIMTGICLRRGSRRR